MRLLQDDCDLKMMTNEALSFIGDGVYGLLVRERLCALGTCRSGTLHTLSAEYVCAKAQARDFAAIEPILTEQETAIYKRGRNAHNNNTPKGTSVMEYHVATGVEALFGYLYLSGAAQRIRELFNRMWAAHANVE